MEWITTLVINAAFYGVCGGLAYSVPGAIIFVVSLFLVMPALNAASFDLGIIVGVMSVALLRGLILPLLARLGLFPMRKEITLIAEVPILLGFGLIFILTTHLTRMLT